MKCESETCNIEENATHSCGSEMECQCDCGCETADPAKQSMERWHKAFHDAMYQAYVERLKKRIETMLGPTLDKAADAMMETAVKIFEAKVTESQSKKEFESKLQKIISETSRR
ncbi:MAG: hypothetical protein HY222_00515 [Thaumarchaeota archaeon]|nr:hypothetical protein [Nitrososphaerota archaeon]MBI3640869.1 hypothetical protein [Nitrososphaerota archaeon]